MHLDRGVYSHEYMSWQPLMANLIGTSALWQNRIKPSKGYRQSFYLKRQSLVGQPEQTCAVQCSANVPRLCSPSVWPCTCSPLGHTRARSNWGPDCGSTVPALVMVPCGKASPVLAGLDKGCEIVNETLPLLLPVNTINKKKKLYCKL